MSDKLATTKAQSILEYVIILSAIVLAIITVKNTMISSDSTGLKQMMQGAAAKIETETADITNIIP